MSSTKKTEGRSPERTCLGCRKKRPQKFLRRLALLENADGVKLVWDDRRRLGGRGAWLCPDKACLALAVKKRAFGRAFHQDRLLDLSALGEVC